MSFRYAAKSDVGRVREGNEDSYLVKEPLFAVADGMGGHLAGDVASRMAVDVLMHDLDTNGDADRESLIDAVKHANSVIFEESQSNAELSGMGTTCTLLYVNGSEGRIAHVGDSRAYLLRGDNLTQLTDDHTLVNRMVKEGRLRPEDAERHPQRSIITRALGVDESVKVDYKTLDLSPGDRVLLCSDGLTSMLDAGVIKRVLSESDGPEAAAEQLIDLANDAGGEDNITVVIVDVADTGDAARPAGAPATETTERPVPRDPIRITTDPTSEGPRRTAQAMPTQRRWLRRLIAWLVALAVLGIGAFMLVSYLLDRSWFVGTNEDGYVAIYQGIPEEVLGFDLKDEAEVTKIQVSDLPEFLRDEVTEGIKVDSEDAATRKVADLRERVQDAGDTQDSERQNGRDQKNQENN